MTPIDKLTDEELNIRCSVLCGFRVEKCGTNPDYPFVLIYPNGSRSCGWITQDEAWSHGLPNYPSDLNAMAEAKKMLTQEQWRKYVAILGEITKANALDAAWQIRAQLRRASAKQLCQAFIMTMEENK